MSEARPLYHTGIAGAGFRHFFPWYFLTIKRHVMNTEQFYADCAAHFLKHYEAGDRALVVFEQYAIEEFNWTEKEAKVFAAQVEKGDAVECMKEGENQRRFYLWYFLNQIKGESTEAKAIKTLEQQSKQQTTTKS
jgi:hypothetical protein